MSRQTKIIVEEVFISKDEKEREQKLNEILMQIINKSELLKVA